MFARPLAASALFVALATLPTLLLDRITAPAAEPTGRPGPPSLRLQALQVAMVSHPTVYLQDRAGHSRGLEHDLVHAFARTIGRAVEIRVFTSVEEARAALVRGEVDMVAAGTTNHTRSHEVATRATYLASPWILVHTPYTVRPRSFAELDPKRVIVSARLAQEPALEQLKRQHPSVEFAGDPHNDDELLMAAVGSGDVPYALIEQVTYDAARHMHYDVEVAFAATPSIPRAWLFRSDAVALRDQADSFLKKLSADGRLEVLLDRYLGFSKKVRAADLEVFIERVNTVLPRFKRWFQEAQEKTGIEWRLLAALAYQESHWNADAVSETGVQGFMQLTEDTARRLGVSDRRDPYQSIMGGARYLAMIKREQIPARIEEPDKTFLALAAYNIGPGHLENARILTARMGRNPDRWVDVRRGLVRLARPEEAAQFNLGPCRCLMPIELVEAVRSYYDILLRMEAPHRPKLQVRRT